MEVNNRTMNSHWQTDLIAQGAHVVDNTIQHYGNLQNELIATANQTVLCDLSHLALLELNGADTLNFLQGQVTNDVKLLGEHNAHLTGYCSPKGRLLAIFTAYAHQSSLYLQLPRVLQDAILKRLKMYVLRSKVTIAESDLITLGISGPDAAKMLASISQALPATPFGKIALGNLTIIKLPSHQFDRYMLISQLELAAGLWSSLKAGCQLVGKPCWDWLDIQAGIPEIVSTTQEQFVPQMANLDLLNGINFKKGCYTGQEIVARTHYLGSVKRRTYLANIATTTIPMAGDKVTNSGLNEVGQLVRVAPGIEGGVDVLVELRMEAKDNGEVFWDKIPLSFKTLPYSFNTGA